VTSGILTQEDAPRPLRRGGSCSDRARAELGGTGPGELAHGHPARRLRRRLPLRQDLSGGVANGPVCAIAAWAPTSADPRGLLIRASAEFRADEWMARQCGYACPALARTCIRSPCCPNRLRTSADSSPVLPNQCGTRVSNSAASPRARTRSCLPRRSRMRPVRTYNHSWPSCARSSLLGGQPATLGVPHSSGTALPRLSAGCRTPAANDR
jgi:hypothetical protein